MISNTPAYFEEETSMPRPSYSWKRVFAVWLLIVGASATMTGIIRFSFAQDDFNPKVVIKREFPAITNAPVMSAEKATEKLQDNEIVLGVVVNGKARAYPINMLTGPSREIINDSLGERSIAATW
jgi:hypothetical protein